MTPRPPFRMLCIGVGFALGAWAAEPRTSVRLDGDWRFFRGEAPGGSAVACDDGAWQRVTIPHTWNTEEDPPQRGYYRGPGWYRKRIAADPSWQGRRIFVRFEAASLVAKVFLNGAEIGEHMGGFAAFCFELTPAWRWDSDNVLAVRVDNARREDVVPLGGDFTVFGGLYRPVSLIVTGPVDITPLDYASPGVFLRPTGVSRESADIAVATEVSNGTAQERPIGVRVEIRDAEGRMVGTAAKDELVSPGSAQTVTQKIVLAHPHLWEGVADPYLYSVRVELSESGRRIDAVEQPLGLRSIETDPARGFALNGHALQIRGVDRHQDWAGVGWAITEKQQDTDMEIMRDMGVTGVRLAHYQHDDYFYRLCDRRGLLVWAELPMVNDLRGTPAFRENVRQQLTELIRQNENHPSVVMWSLYNEISPANKDDPAAVVADLKNLAKTEDPSRPTTGALSMEGIAKLPAVGKLNDLLALNVYPGWYVGAPGDMGSIIDRWNQAYGSRGILISEYGAGASVRQHQQDFTGRTGRAPKDWHPEEWQSLVHELNYADIVARPAVYGTFVWNMFDFASAGRREGDLPGINDKGLVTRDRQVKKDAYFFYQSNWTAEPMVHITSRRDRVRAVASTPVKVYSNCARVLLRVNGKSRGEAAGSALHVFVWKGVQLDEGNNRIEVEAASARGIVRDSCEWIYEAKKALSLNSNPLP